MWPKHQDEPRALGRCWTLECSVTQVIKSYVTQENTRLSASQDIQMYDMRDKGTCDQVQRADAPWAHKAFVVLCLPGSDRVCSDLNNVLQEEHPQTTTILVMQTLRRREEENMTLQEIKNMDREFITPGIAAKILGCDPQYLRITARQAREELGFPVVILRSRVKIPRLAFIRYMEGEVTA